MEYLELGVSWVSGIFDFISQLDTKFHFLSIVIGVTVAHLSYRFLLAPIFGGTSGSSDQVKKERKK